MSEPLAYSVNAAAEHCSVSPDTIKRAIRSGALRAKKSGRLPDGTPTGKYIVPREALADWLDGLADA